MFSSLNKWVAATAGSVIVAAAVPALAAHVTHKHLSTKHHASHALVATSTPSLHSKTHVTHTSHLSSKKAKTLSTHHKHTLASKHHKTTKLAMHKHTKLDKTTSKTSNM